MKRHRGTSALGKPGASEFVDLIEDCARYGKSARLSDLLNRVLDRSGLKRMLREDQDEDRLENVDELLQSVRFYESTRSEDEVTLAGYLQDIALYTNQDYRKDTPTVKLMTIHQAKGLEFPYVFIIGLSEGIFRTCGRSANTKRTGGRGAPVDVCGDHPARKALFLTESEGFNISTKMNNIPPAF